MRIGSLLSQDIAEIRAFLAEENAKYPEKLVELEFPATTNTQSGPRPLRVLRSRFFLVQEYPADAPAVVRLTVNRSAIKDDASWEDGITWDELQQVKRECGYGDKDAVEVYPRDSDVVNVSNMRHLWVLDDMAALDFAWRADDLGEHHG